MIPLEAKVKAQNDAAKRGNKLQAELQEAFAPLVGRKVVRAGGYLMQKYAKIGKFPATQSMEIHHRSNEYTLSWTVTATVSDNSGKRHCQTVVVPVGHIRDGILTELSDRLRHRENHTDEEVQSLRDEYQRLRERCSEIEIKLSEFGKQD